mgnify:CR=1 FL=1
MRKKYQDLMNNTLLFAISSFGTKILSFLLVPLYTNLLSTTEYGTVDLLNTTTTLLIVVLTINISEGVLIFAMDKRYLPSEVLSFGIKVILFGWGILTLGEAISYIIGIFNWPIYYYIFVLIFFAVSAIYQTLSNYLRAVDRVKDVALAGIISSITYLLCNILFLLVFHMGMSGYLIATIIGPLIGVIYCLLAGGITIRGILKEHITREQCYEILKYCIPLIFNSIALWINSCLDRYFVTYFCGVDQNGIYSVASKIPLILSTVYTVFSQAWTLSAVKEFDPEDKDGFFSKTYETYNAVMAIACSILIFINIPLAKFIYAKDFFIAWRYSSVLLLGIFFNSLTAFIGSIFSATKNSNVLATTTVFSAIINTVLNICLIPQFGVQGATVATAIALFIMWALRMIKLRKLIRIKINWINDILVLVLLCMQIVVEHLEGHMYLIQGIIVFLVIIIMHKQFADIVKKLLKHN